MMNRWIWMTALLTVGTPLAANAQLAVELRGGGTVGNHGPAASGLETIPGPSLSATSLARATSWLTVYGSLMRVGFGCEEGFCTGRSVDIRSTGWGGGLRLTPGAIPWVQAGILRLATDVDAEEANEVGSPELSVEAAAGLSFPAFGAIHVVPAVIYRAGLDAHRRTTTVTGELGVRIAVPRFW